MNLSINGDRLWAAIQASAEIGKTEKGGLNRQTLTDDDRRMRDLFISWCVEAGCTVTVDRLGNIVARRDGRDNSLAPIAFGSHLDTQPTGGKFDGVLGVLAGLEIMRTLQETGYVTNAPLELINWTNEEGARFAPAMLASGVRAGVFDLDFALSRQDADGAVFGEELARIGYNGAEPIDRPCGAFFELHIEQGPILERDDTTIGVVVGGQGAKWYDIVVLGKEAHSATTPMAMRTDALQGAVAIVGQCSTIAERHGVDGKATVGLISVKPGSRNVIPGEVHFSIDLRHPDKTALESMDVMFKSICKEIATDRNLQLSIQPIWDSPPIKFDTGCVEAVRSAAKELGLSHQDIISGAGHDAVYMSRVAPSAMIFIPCKDGISHNESEDITSANAAAGANVLLRAVLARAG